LNAARHDRSGGQPPASRAALGESDLFYDFLQLLIALKGGYRVHFEKHGGKLHV
jgi:hypothetical protein